MNGSLLCINGVWVTDPDPESWGPVRNAEWTSDSGRTSSHEWVGAKLPYKYSLPCKWKNLTAEENGEIQSLIEDSGDYLNITFRHNGGYIQKTMYASTYTPSGIKKAGGVEYYSECSCTFVEK